MFSTCLQYLSYYFQNIFDDNNSEYSESEYTEQHTAHSSMIPEDLMWYQHRTPLTTELVPFFTLLSETDSSKSSSVEFSYRITSPVMVFHCKCGMNVTPPLLPVKSLSQLLIPSMLPAPTTSCLWLSIGFIWFLRPSKNKDWLNKHWQCEC